MEHKQVDAYITGLDEEQGIVEAIFAVMGNIDEGWDMLHNGAFTKTFMERGQDIALLDNHQTDSIMRSLGSPIAFRELPRAELPPELLAKYPDATGAAWGKFQFMLDTPEGLGAFKRLKRKAVKKWSFGYDTLDYDYSKGVKDGIEGTVRNLRTLKLYEVSPVLFAMNTATNTLSAKSAGPTEGKPWDVFKEGDKWRVYKLDADGKPTGDSLGEHATEEEAQSQVRALYANEPDAGKEGLSVKPKNSTGSDEFEVMSEVARTGVSGREPEAIKVGRAIAKRNAARIAQMRTILAELEKEAGLLMDEEDDEEDDGAPNGAAPDDSQKSKAGPADMPPTKVDALDIETLELELTLLEV